MTKGSRLLCRHRSKFSSAAGHSLRAKLNHLSLGLLLEGEHGDGDCDDDDDDDGEFGLKWSIV